MKNFTRKNAEKYIEKRLKELENQGYDTERILKGKTPKQYAWSRNSLNQFKKHVNREKQREKIIQENIENDKRMAEKREQRKIENQKRSKRNYISKSTRAIVKHNLHVEPSKMNIRRITALEADKFFDRYFKSTRSNVELQNKVNQLKRRFGNRLDLLHEFIDRVSKIDFKYEMDGIVFSKDEFKTDFADDWDNMMNKRLDKMYSLLNEEDFRI